MTLPLPLGGITDGTLRFVLERLASQFPIGTANILDSSVTSAKLNLTQTRVAASSDLTLTTTLTDVPGCTYTTTAAGTFLVLTVYDFNITTAGGGLCLGRLLVDGVVQSSAAVLADAAGLATVAQNYIVTTGASKVIKMQAQKFVAAGTSLCKATHTTMTILQIA